jgi:hypothetical protein
MSYSMEAFKMAFGKGSPRPNAKALTASVRELVNRIPRAARGRPDSVQQLLAFAREAAQAIKDGDLNDAAGRIAELRDLLDLAEDAPNEDHQPQSKPLPRTPAVVVRPAASVATSSASAAQAPRLVSSPAQRNVAPPSTAAVPETPRVQVPSAAAQASATAAVAAMIARAPQSPTPASNSNNFINSQNLMLDESPEKEPPAPKINAEKMPAATAQVASGVPNAVLAVPVAQRVAPTSPPAAHSVAEAQPEARGLPVWDGARKEALKFVARLRALLVNATEREPYLSDLSKRAELAKAITAEAERLDGKVSVGNDRKLTDAERLRAYKAATEAARTAVIKFLGDVETAQGKVAAACKAAFDALTTDEGKKAWVDQHARSIHGQQIIDDMVARLGGRAKTDQDKKLVKLVIAAETAYVQTLRNQKANYLDGYCYKKVKATPWMLQELKNFARRDQTRENLLFLEAVEDGASNTRLLNEFIIEDSPNYINLPAAIRENFKKAKDDLDAAVADRSLAERRGELQRTLQQCLSKAVHEIESLVDLNLVSRLAAKRKTEYDAQINQLQEKLGQYANVKVA